MIQKLSTQNIATFSTCKSKIYCRTKTRYRKKERESSLNNNLGVNSSKTFTYSMNLFDAGIFSINLISQAKRKKNKMRMAVMIAEISNKTLIQKTERPIIGPGCVL